MTTYRHITRIYNEVLHVIDEAEHHVLYGTDDREIWLDRENELVMVTPEQSLILEHMALMDHSMGVKIIGRKLEIILNINKLEDEQSDS